MPPKPKKKQQKPQLSVPGISVKDKIIASALLLAAEQNWTFVTVRNIAEEAGIDLPEFYDIFESKDDILSAYGRKLDNRVLQAFADFNPETPVRDLIFDILMERFDLANADKAGIKSIFESYRSDPKQFLMGLSQLGASMTRMLEAAGLDAYGWKGAARVAGLTAATIWVTRIWLEDGTQDLSKTMSALDKALSKIENLADRFGL